MTLRRLTGLSTRVRMDIGRDGCAMEGRDVTYLGARLQMGKVKGRREGDDTTSGGDIGSRRRQHAKEKVKTTKKRH